MAEDYEKTLILLTNIYNKSSVLIDIVRQRNNGSIDGGILGDVILTTKQKKTLELQYLQDIDNLKMFIDKL